MEKRIGFAKNDKGKYIEGYLSDKEHFNGVLFILKEPNTNDQGEFYFRECVSGKINDMKKYINVFNDLLKNHAGSVKLNECAYANIIPTKGEKNESKSYKNLPNDERFKRINSFIDKYNPKIIFVCSKDFDALINEENLKTEDGIIYKYLKPKRLTHYKDVNIYEIYHPAYRRNLETKKTAL